MTNNKKVRRVAGATLIAVSLGACDFISPVESNPNAVPTATVDQLFTSAQIVSYWLGAGGLSRIASIWTQQMAGTDRQFATFDAYVITDADFEDEFNALYTQGGLVDIRNAIAQAEAAGRMPYAGILKVHEAYLVGMHASYWGDIPYREAVSSVTQPVLDDQAQVYADVQALLDEAIVDLGGTGAGPGAVDMNFQGNTARWIAVANTLKARFRMHLVEAEGAGTTNATAARTAALAGIQVAAGSWRARFGNAQPESNLWTQFLVDRSGYVSSGDFLIPLMNGRSDPRRPIYFSEASPGVYTSRVSLLSATGYGNAAYDIPLVTCAENQFILAEAEYRLGNAIAARAAGRAGLACEEATHGLAADALGSVTGFPVTLVGGALLEEIMTQKYIAQFLNTDAFNDYKRTCLPAAIVERPGGMPGRLFYSAQERNSNTNVPATGVDPNDKYNDNDPTPCP